MSYSSQVISLVPSAYYRLGESSGSSAADSSGNGRTGTITAPVTLGAPGLVNADANTSFDFNGGAVSLPAMGIVPAGPRTFECWTKRRDLSDANRVLVTSGGSGTGQAFRMEHSFASYGDIFIDFGGFGFRTAGNALPYLERTHVVIVWDSGLPSITTCHCYINGVEQTLVAVGTASVSLVTDSGYSIGGLAGFPSVGHTGYIDEVAIYPVALSPAQVLANYRANVTAKSTLQVSFQALGFGAMFHWLLGLWIQDRVPLTLDANADYNYFNPTELDVGEWLDAAVAFGMKYAYFTARHHIGFCMWPTSAVNVSVADTDWSARMGKNDIVLEFVNQCTARNIIPCLYYSVTDKNFEETVPGYTQSQYRTNNQTQLTELLTNYGQIGAIWFDLANATVSGQPYYPWRSYGEIYDFVKSISPNTIVGFNSPLLKDMHTADVATYEVYFPGGGGDGFPPASTPYLSEAVVQIRSDRTWDELDPPSSIDTAATITGNRNSVTANNGNFVLALSPDQLGRMPWHQFVRSKQVGGDGTAPASPTGVTATPLDGAAVVSFTAVSSEWVSRYEYRVDSGLPHGIGTQTSFALPNLVNGSTYAIQLRSVDSSRNYSGWSSAVNVTPSSSGGGGGGGGSPGATGLIWARGGGGPFKIGGAFTVGFTTYDSSLTPVNVGTLPTVTLRRGTVIDTGVMISVVALGGGQYSASGTIPSGYSLTDSVHLVPDAIFLNGYRAANTFALSPLDTKAIGQLNDAPDTTPGIDAVQAAVDNLQDTANTLETDAAAEARKDEILADLAGVIAAATEFQGMTSPDGVFTAAALVNVPGTGGGGSGSWPFVRGQAVNNLRFAMSLNRVPVVVTTITALISKDGGTFAPMSTTPTAGLNSVNNTTVTGTEMDAESIAMIFTAVGADPLVIHLRTVPA